MMVVEHSASERVERLRAALLPGRGPGASSAEVKEHTRDRPLLRGVPATGGPEGRNVSSPPPSFARTTNPSAIAALTPQHCSPVGAAVIGALTALIVQPVASRLTRSLRRAGHEVRR